MYTAYIKSGGHMGRKKDLLFTRGRAINFRLRSESQERFDQIYDARKASRLNYNKSDIMSEAIDLLYEKEEKLLKGLHEPQK